MEQEQYYLTFEATNERVSCRDGTALIVEPADDQHLDEILMAQSSRIRAPLEAIEVGDYLRRYTSKERETLVRTSFRWLAKRLDLGDEVDIDEISTEYVFKAF